MGPKRSLAFLAFAGPLVLVAAPARAADYVQGPSIVVPAVDPGPVTAISSEGSVTFEGNPYVAAGAINANGFLGVTFSGPTTADAIGITTTNTPVSAAGGLAARAGAITINAGTGDAVVGGLAVAVDAVSGQIAATNLALSGIVSVPATSLVTAPFTVAATTTTGTVALNIAGVPAAPFVAGTRIKVFAWTGITHAITVSAITGPPLDPGLVYSAAEVPVGGDIVVAAIAVEPDAGTDAGPDAGADGGLDAGPDPAPGDAGDASDAGPDGSEDPPLTGGPPLGDIFYDDGGGCAFVPAASAATGLPAAALALLALLGRRRRQFR